MRTASSLRHIATNKINRVFSAPLNQSWLPKRREAIKVTRIEEPTGRNMTRSGGGIVRWVGQHPVAAGALAVGGVLVLPGLIFSTLAFAAKLAIYGALAWGGVIVIGKVIGKSGGGGNYRI